MDTWVLPQVWGFSCSSSSCQGKKKCMSHLSMDCCRGGGLPIVDAPSRIQSVLYSVLGWIWCFAAHRIVVFSSLSSTTCVEYRISNQGEESGLGGKTTPRRHHPTSAMEHQQQQQPPPKGPPKQPDIPCRSCDRVLPATAFSPRQYRKFVNAATRGEPHSGVICLPCSNEQTLEENMPVVGVPGPR